AVKVVRSPHARARILTIDASAARSVPGVACVATAADVPGRNCIPVVMRDLPLFAAGEARYHGEPVAVVGAETEEAAEEAARLVRVEWEPLQPLTDPLAALEPGAPVIHSPDNVFRRWQVRKGDAGAALARAAVVVENEYRTPYQEHAYLETQGMLAVPTPDGGIEVSGSMQCPFYVREGLAEVLGLPLAKVRVVQAATGGGFGGKEDVPSIVAGQAAVVAWMTGRPARVIYSRDEDILSMSKRHPAVIRSSYGFAPDGTLLAAKVRYVLDAGAYSTLSPVVSWRGTVHAVGPYRCENVAVDTVAVATNKVPCGAFRGFGQPQVLFAAECQMDEAAARLGLDPIELRRRNALRDGDETPTGQRLRAEVGLSEAIDRVEAASGWREKRASPPARPSDSSPAGRGSVNAAARGRAGGRAYGIGCSAVFYGVSLGAGGKALDRAGSYVQMMYDGSACFAVGTTEMGQGMFTVLSQVVAEELGVPYEAVRPMAPDTAMVPDSGPTVASRTTVMSGNSLKDACRPIRRNLLEVAGGILGCDPAAVRLADGVATAPDGRQAGYGQVLRQCFLERRCLASSGWSETPPVTWDEGTGAGEPYMTYAFAVNVVEVEVDRETGEVRVLAVHAAHDVGRAINPMAVEGQIEGGTAQGLGYALTEEILHRDGRMLNHQFSTYLIPTAPDVPPIHAIVVEHPTAVGPYGAKGFGEQPLMGVAPAVANAVAHAVGVRFREIPLTPERVWAALRDADREGTR
ncbi:MAG: xanthine dehydrogenase family protein, partial [Deltaproteobacteria bacterium]|nr:xanthine dehydrogenase family protein [Deltaproteobacteria bacterium]